MQALYNPKHLGLVEPPEKVAKPEWVLIYGGSSKFCHKLCLCIWSDH